MNLGSEIDAICRRSSCTAQWSRVQKIGIIYFTRFGTIH